MESALSAITEVEELEISTLQLKLQNNNKSIYRAFSARHKGKKLKKNPSFRFLNSPNRDNEAPKHLQHPPNTNPIANLDYNIFLDLHNQV